MEPIFQVETFILYQGERVDVVLNANFESVTNHWIRAQGIARCARAMAHQTAILRYVGAPEEHPDAPDDYESGSRTGVVFIIRSLKCCKELVS